MGRKKERESVYVLLGRKDSSLSPFFFVFLPLFLFRREGGVFTFFS